MSLQSSMDPASSFWGWLESVRDDYRRQPEAYPTGRVLNSPFGACGIMAGDDEYDDFGAYITVGFNLPDGVFAEIEDDTYGQMQGFRIYLDDSGD